MPARVVNDGLCILPPVFVLLPNPPNGFEVVLEPNAPAVLFCEAPNPEETECQIICREDRIDFSTQATTDEVRDGYDSWNDLPPAGVLFVLPNPPKPELCWFALLFWPKPPKPPNDIFAR